jgi:hypothetical protein
LSLSSTHAYLKDLLFHLRRLLLEPLDDTLVDASQLVDKVTCDGGFAGVDMADDHDVDVSLLFPHMAERRSSC